MPKDRGNRTRKNELKIYLSDNEKYILDRKVELSKRKSASDYIRTLILFGFVYDVDYSYLKQYNETLGKISGNLNQIAKRINSTGNVYEEDAVMSALGSFENKTQLKEEIACEKLAFKRMEIDASKRLVYRGEKEVNITFTEFEILHLLARNPGRVFSKEQIYDIVWKESYSGDYNIVMSHIRNIREKIEDNPSKPIYIQTVWGVGYKFDNKLK